MHQGRPSSSYSNEADSLDAAFDEARPKDPVGLLFAKSRVAAGLFGEQEASGPGRFQLLDRLGAGGMGVIYAAYDPQLERAVAVKVVYVPESGSSDALAEAKALARLSHPNVVTIFDYGFVDEHLYIVMELILGQTLRRWAIGRTLREIVKAYSQAGEALAAAHSVGLVHRDFKPDNAIMSPDGRVRVVDFGLACEAADPSRPSQAPPRSAGTPGYMAPEQVSGSPITAAADQYGFCTALRDALRDNGAVVGVPRWLQAVIDRGRSPDPNDRFASMQSLLGALACDPAVTKRRWFIGALLLASGATVAAGSSAALDARQGTCAGGEDRLGSAWGVDGREAALDRVANISPYGMSLQPRLREALADHSRRWAAGYREACLARATSLQSETLTDRRMACLDRGRAALGTVANIVTTATAGDLSDVILAVQALPNPDACADLNTLLIADAEPPPVSSASRIEELRRQLEQARIQIAAGRSSQVRAMLEASITAARSLAYKPLLAEVLLLQGHALMTSDDRVAAMEPLHEAFTTAFQSDLPSLAVEAWARWAWARGTSVGGEESLSGLAVVEAVAARQSTSRFARALLYNNVGGVELALQRRDRAREAFTRASREARGLASPDSIELMNVNVNLGLVTDDPSRRDELLAAAIADKSRILGDDHPETLEARWYRGKEAVSFPRSLEILTPTCAALQKQAHFRAARCWLEVGYIRHELDDVSGAVDALQRAASIDTAHDSRLPLIPVYLLAWRGDDETAARAFSAALDEHSDNPQDPWWDRLQRAELELGLGRVLRSSGNLPEAKRVLTSSLETLCAVVSQSPSSSVERRVGRARSELAKVLSALRQSRATASALAESALTWLGQSNGTAGELLELEHIAQGVRHGGQEICPPFGLQ